MIVTCQRVLTFICIARLMTIASSSITCANLTPCLNGLFVRLLIDVDLLNMCILSFIATRSYWLTHLVYVLISIDFLLI